MALLFDKQEKFKSSFGGFVSLFLYATILAYLVLQLMNIVNFEAEIAQSSYIRNIFSDDTVYNLTEENFEIAVKLQSILFDE